MIALGDFPTGGTVELKWSTSGGDGASITRSTDGTLKIYKGSAATERTSLAGVTQTEDVDTTTGVHHVTINLADNTDAGFYAAGSEYHVVMTGMVIDTKTVNAVLGHFSIERAGGILATLKSVVSGAGVNVTQLAGGTQSLTDLKDFADDGYDPATNKVQGVALVDTLTTYTGNTPQTGDSFARLGALGAGLTALASQASVTTLQGYVDTEVAAIKAKTDNLPSDPADESTLQATLATLSTLTAAQAAAAVWDAVRSGHATAGTFGQGVASVQGAVTGAVGSVTGAVTVGTNTDKAGYSLSAAAVQALWDALTSALTAAGSIGKLLVDNIDATISSRTKPADTQARVTLVDTLTSYSGNTPQTGDAFARIGALGIGLSAIPDLAGLTTLLARLTAARAGYLDNMNNATLVGAVFPPDPADQSLVIAATNALGTAIGALQNLSAAQVNTAMEAALFDVGLTPTVTGRIDAAISSRLAAASYTPPLDADGTRSAVGLAVANLDTQLGAIAGFIDTEVQALSASLAALNNLSSVQVEDAVWNAVLASHLTAGSTGAGLNAAGAVGDPWSTALPGAYGAGTAGQLVSTTLDAAISSRLANAGYTAPLTAAATRTALGLATANLDTQLAALSALLDTEVAAILAVVDTEVAAIKAKTDLLPASPAASGDAAAVLDQADAIETGLTLRQALRLIAAACAGKASGLAGATATYRAAVSDATDRIVAVTTEDGDRTAITYSLD